MAVTAGPVAAACTGPPAPVPPTALPATDSPTPTPSADSDDTLRAGVGQSELDLIAAYAAAFAAHPKLRKRYGQFAAAHAAHLREVSGHEVPEVSPLPLDRGVVATQRWLAGLEAAAADQRAAAADSARAGDLVSLLTLVSASEAQHEVVLRAAVAQAAQTP